MSANQSLQFTIDGEPGALVTITETDQGTLLFDVLVHDNIAFEDDEKDIADLRGLFFHIADESLLDPTKLKVSGADVGDVVVGKNAVTKITNDALIEGGAVDAYAPFDIGVEIGSQGMGKDDIQHTIFVLSHDTQALTLALVAEQYFGLRLTSVSLNGVGREESLKLPGTAPKLPADGENPGDPNGPGDGDTDGPGGVDQPGDTDGPDPSAHTYDDLIEAGAGNDTIYGGRGNDEMQGEGGDDLISGGTDNGHLLRTSGLTVAVGDNLYGNDGRDTFLYTKGDGVDLIWDFQPSQDEVLLSGYSSTEIETIKQNIVFVRHVNNRIGTGDHDKIAMILNGAEGAAEGGIIFNDYPNPSSNDVAIRFDDGTTISSAQLLALARQNSIAAGGYIEINHTSANDEFTGQNLYGLNYDDTLVGSVGNDRLYGNEGSDILVGNAGSDKLYGTGGGDVIYGDEADGLTLTTTITNPDNTTDTPPTTPNNLISIITSTSFTLGAETLNLTAAGKANVKLTGNALDNSITGNKGKNAINGESGDDYVNGGLGNDSLTGGQGEDAFLFTTKLGTPKTDRKVNFDKVTDFSAADDSLYLDNAVFRKLGSGSPTNPKQLKKAFFTIGDKAKDANDYIIYNKKTGALSYDVDGTGTKAAIEFAQVKKGSGLTYKDFFVI
jgi:Ca2+-binding RTX toxin-like protein